MKNTNFINAIAIGVIMSLSACGGGSSTPTPTPTPTPTGTTGAINVISTTNSTDPTTTYGASLKALAESSHGVYLLTELSGVKWILGNQTASDCANGGTQNPATTVSQSGTPPNLNAGTMSGGETFTSCGAFVESILSFSGAYTFNLTSNSPTAANVSFTWANPIAVTYLGVNGLSGNLAAGSFAMSGAGLDGNGNGTFVYSNTTSNPTLSFQFGASSNYSASNLNGSIVISGCTNTNNTPCTQTVASSVGSGLLANVTKGSTTYAVSVVTPLVYTTDLTSAIGLPTSGSINVTTGNATCGTLSATYLSNGTGLTMSCSTAPTVTQQVLFSGRDWTTVFNASNQ